MARLARAHGVEQADDRHRHLPLVVVREGEELVERLGAGVAPASLGRRAHDDVAVLAVGQVGAEPVHLGRRGEQHALPFLRGGREDHLGGLHVVLDRADRAVDHPAHPHLGREVVDHVHAVHQLGRHALVLHAVDRVVEVRVPLQVLDVVDAAGRQVIDHEHLVAAQQARIREMTSYEPGAAGDQYTHL